MCDVAVVWCLLIPLATMVCPELRVPTLCIWNISTASCFEDLVLIEERSSVKCGVQLEIINHAGSSLREFCPRCLFILFSTSYGPRRGVPATHSPLQLVLPKYMGPIDHGPSETLSRAVSLPNTVDVRHFGYWRK